MGVIPPEPHLRTGDADEQGHVPNTRSGQGGRVAQGVDLPQEDKGENNHGPCRRERVAARVPLATIRVLQHHRLDQVGDDDEAADRRQQTI